MESLKDLKELYNKAYDNFLSLPTYEAEILIEDFIDRANSKISTNSGGTYIIKHNCKDCILNGFLVNKPEVDKVVDLKILLEKSHKITISDEMEVFLLNCDYDKIAESETNIETSIEPVADNNCSESISDNAEYTESKDMSIIIDQLEKITKLKETGAISKEEFEKLKNSIIG